MFIARISRGRTIREFMLGVMFVPTTIAFFWLCIFGGNAIHIELTAEGGVGTAGIAQLVRDWNLSSALYGTIELMTDVNWLNWVMAALATFLLATWFITSSDSGTLVITTMLSMGGRRSRRSGSGSCGGSAKASWRRSCCSREGLKALQTAAIAAALPVSVIMMLMTFGIVKSLSEDPSAVPASGGPAEPEPAG